MIYRSHPSGPRVTVCYYWKNNCIRRPTNKYFIKTWQMKLRKEILKGDRIMDNNNGDL